MTLFFFPTRGENFGHVIFEALKAGLPVITSDHTPWNFLDKQPFFWAINVEDKNGYLSAINELSVKKRSGLRELRIKALEQAGEFAKQDELIAQYRLLFRK